MATTETIDPFPTEEELIEDFESELDLYFAGTPGIIDPRNYKTGSVYQFAMKPYVLAMDEVKNMFEEVKLSLHTDTTLDEDELEYRLVQRGLERKLPVPATVTIRIGKKLLLSNETIVITHGLRVYAEDEFSGDILEFIYLEDQSVIIDSNTPIDEDGYSTVDLTFTADEPGLSTGYEGISVGKIVNPGDEAIDAGIDYCYNITESSGGQDLEQLEEMRQRLNNSESVFDNWTDSWIREKALSVDGVTYCEIYKKWAPFPAVLQIVVGGLSGGVSDVTLQNVYNALYHNKDSSISFEVATIKDFKVNLNFVIYYETEPVSQITLKTVVENWFSLTKEGENFERDSLQLAINKSFKNIRKFDWKDVEKTIEIFPGYKTVLGNFSITQSVY